MHLNWLAKIELRGAREPCNVVNVVVNYCCKRKMLKENGTEKTLGFFVTFLLLVTFQFGERTPWDPWLRLWGPDTVPYGKSSPVYCITFIKKLDEALR